MPRSVPPATFRIGTGFAALCVFRHCLLERVFGCSIYLSLRHSFYSVVLCRWLGHSRNSAFFFEG